MESRAEIVSANILAVEITTNAPQGGDAGHGAKTTVLLEDRGGTAWNISIEDDSGLLHIESPKRITLTVLGDSEAETLARAFLIAGRSLQSSMTLHVHDTDS